MDRRAWRAKLMGLQRVRHNLVTKQQQQIYTHASNIGASHYIRQMLLLLLLLLLLRRFSRV